MAFVTGKQTPQQFNEHFKAVLNSLINKTFSANEELLFVTYQPDELVLSNVELAAHTHELFGSIKYVQVIEQTFLHSKVYNSGNYINGFHSHLIVSQSEYATIETQLQQYDIVAKVVYDIDGLANRYLAKQAGVTINRLLPTVNIPTPKAQPIVEPEIIVLAVPKPKFVLQTKSFIANVLIRINKIIGYLQFIDDT